MTHDVWVEVDLSALQHNFKQVRSVVADGVGIVAVVKASGYGHGYVEPSKAFMEAGADALAVTRFDEAMLLRDAGITSPILLLAPIQAENAEAAVEADLWVTVASLPLAQAVSQAAQKDGKIARVHVKVDTGMGRLGVLPDQTIALVESIAGLPGVHIGGIFTHFATAAEPDDGPARTQFAVFESVLDELRSRGIEYGCAHAANSSAILRMPGSHLDMVRTGTLLFGQYPSKYVPHKLDLRPTFTLKARICEIKNLPAGARVGYGGECKLTRPTKTAVVPIGWADGFTVAPEGPIYRQGITGFAARKFRRSLCMELHGKQAPVLGRIAMQMTILDVTGIEDVTVGDAVTVPALRIPTSPIVPRVYLS